MTDIVKVKPKTFGDLKVGEVFTFCDKTIVALVKINNVDDLGIMNAVRLSRPDNQAWMYEIGNDTVVFLPTEISVVF